jgi:hypothetical protein
LSRGPGDTQRALLTELAAAEDWALTTADLARRVHRNPRQIRTAVASLVRRRLVVTTRATLGWKGEGEYGSFTYGHNRDMEGEPAGGIGWGQPRLYTSRPSVRILRYWHQGTPTFGLRVWLPLNRARYLIEEWEHDLRAYQRWGDRPVVPAAYDEMAAVCELAGVPTPERPEWLGTEP